MSGGAQVRADMKNFEVTPEEPVCKHPAAAASVSSASLQRSVTLKPNVAYCMIRMSGLSQLSSTGPRNGAAGLREQESLLDPFCGGGTIPMEAACMFGCAAPATGCFFRLFGAHRDQAGRLCGCDRSKTGEKQDLGVRA
eukprot:759148-Hanusia_phi.AAC.1